MSGRREEDGIDLEKISKRRFVSEFDFYFYAFGGKEDGE